MDRTLKKSLLFTLAIALAIQTCTFAEENKLPPVKYDGLTKYEKDADSPEYEERMKELKKEYKGVTKDVRVINALELMKGTLGEFSRNAIIGKNLTGKPIGSTAITIGV